MREKIINCKLNMCKLIMTFVGLVLYIIELIYYFFLLSETKKDTLQQPFEIGEKDNFFYSDLNDIKIEKKCEPNQHTTMNPDVEQLSDVFDLNIKSIHKTIIILAILVIVLIVLIIISSIIVYIGIKKENTFLLFFSFILLFGMAAITITHFIFFIRLILSYYRGDTYRFVKFLSCKNVNKDAFRKYLFVETFQKDFNFFIIINIIQYFVNAFTKSENKEENNE